jgi:hypothetical protein
MFEHDPGWLVIKHFCPKPTKDFQFRGQKHPGLHGWSSTIGQF